MKEMSEKTLCSSCYHVLPYSNKDHVICSNCGEVNWLEDLDSKLLKTQRVKKSKKQKMRRGRKTLDDELDYEHIDW